MGSVFRILGRCVRQISKLHSPPLTPPLQGRGVPLASPGVGWRRVPCKGGECHGQQNPVFGQQKPLKRSTFSETKCLKNARFALFRYFSKIRFALIIRQLRKVTSSHRHFVTFCGFDREEILYIYKYIYLNIYNGF